ncbi:transglutaminase-like putative cysteine protease [Plasticicumulans lactativorans]|uniref:Transglutaminase-like putative cysteine protease n=1 Tax=Plasticicumulans lactativorans TaxID=1133106 RepID=A0A4R2L9M9_9GAMM|nr:transglutaminase family protein [Plasticicumulans lactativorans]TCO82063.1 transglutaminase-like putative cysteine protease [Plasticicumulans lactativorans]
MNYTVTHRTAYRYRGRVALCHNEAMLMPRETAWQFVPECRIEIEPRPALSAERTDFFGNRVLYFAIQDIHQTLTVTVTSQVTVAPRPLTPDLPSPPWEEVVQLIREMPELNAMEARQFTLESTFIRPGDELANYALPSFTPGRPLLEAAFDLTRRIFAEFTYDPHFSTIATPLTQVLEERRGVCQDFAHLAIACLRSLGLAARYVSGYLETLPPPGAERLIGADASHAWLAVFIPGLGWVDLDPTNDCMPGERHVTLAWGRDYADVAPLKGVMMGGGAHKLDVSVDVAPQPR